MTLVGLEFLQSQFGELGFTAKMVFNHRGAIFFPVSQASRSEGTRDLIRGRLSRDGAGGNDRPRQD